MAGTPFTSTVNEHWTSSVFGQVNQIWMSPSNHSLCSCRVIQEELQERSLVRNWTRAHCMRVDLGNPVARYANNGHIWVYRDNAFHLHTQTKTYVFHLRASDALWFSFWRENVSEILPEPLDSYWDRDDSCVGTSRFDTSDQIRSLPLFVDCTFSCVPNGFKQLRCYRYWRSLPVSVF